jgi:hypothetical protein
MAGEILTECPCNFNLSTNGQKPVSAAIPGLEIMLKWQSASFAEPCD